MTFKNTFKLLVSFLLIFSMVSCNEKTAQMADQAQEMLDSSTPLGTFLSASDKPAVIKFHAEWCSTCKKYAPTYEKVSADMSEAVAFYEVDVDDASFKALIKQLKISRIPETVFINAQRTSISKKLGAIPRVKLVKIIETQLLDS